MIFDDPLLFVMDLRLRRTLICHFSWLILDHKICCVSTVSGITLEYVSLTGFVIKAFPFYL
jgi:hypothetical protein